jgi:mRNA interferase RelE/StbE
MRFKVQVREQVWDFAQTLGLENRRTLKRAITALATERGDIRALTDELSGFYRLRVGRFRVIFRYLPGRVIDCVFVEERKLVYEVFESELQRILGGQ